MNAPCQWPLSFAGCAGGTPPAIWAGAPEESRDLFARMAAEYLWRWTGRTLGVCEVTVRPCRQDCPDGRSTFHGSGPSGSLRWQPVLIGGEWFNLGCGSCGDACDCYGATSALRLPGPVASVVEVNLDGEILDPDTAYRLEGDRLYRVDGKGWPTCQNMAAAPGEPGAWTITYEHGVPVPPGGQVAAGLLAIELLKAACGDKSCGLPQRVQTVTRQGVSVAVLDSFDDIDKGHTGIWLIDSWVASMSQPPRRSVVLSPDTRARMRTSARPERGTP